MTDLELLQKAAMAAGYEFSHYNQTMLSFWDNNSDNWWNPLTNDADAFRLMVDLVIDVSISKKKKTVKAVNHKTECIIVSFKLGDKHAATRRAIVLAAAKMIEDK
jgi:hypothetical protein